MARSKRVTTPGSRYPLLSRFLVNYSLHILLFPGTVFAQEVLLHKSSRVHGANDICFEEDGECHVRPGQKTMTLEKSIARPESEGLLVRRNNPAILIAERDDIPFFSFI